MLIDDSSTPMPMPGGAAVKRHRLHRFFKDLTRTPKYPDDLCKSEEVYAEHIQYWMLREGHVGKVPENPKANQQKKGVQR